MPGSNANPVKLAPIHRIVEVGWPGEYIVWQFKIGWDSSGSGTRHISPTGCDAGDVDYNASDGLNYRTSVARLTAKLYAYDNLLRLFRRNSIENLQSQFGDIFTLPSALSVTVNFAAQEADITDSPGSDPLVDAYGAATLSFGPVINSQTTVGGFGFTDVSDWPSFDPSFLGGGAAFGMDENWGLSTSADVGFQYYDLGAGTLACVFYVFSGYYEAIHFDSTPPILTTTSALSWGDASIEYEGRTWVPVAAQKSTDTTEDTIIINVIFQKQEIG